MHPAASRECRVIMASAKKGNWCLQKTEWNMIRLPVSVRACDHSRRSRRHLHGLDRLVLQHMRSVIGHKRSLRLPERTHLDSS
jgi:hypothetical protein